jgi:curved DNA-binding protein CbpA
MSLGAAMKVFNITSPFSSETDLKSHYKKLALQHHPDHGGSMDKMKEVNLAKEILSNNIGKTSATSFKIDHEKRDQEYRDLKKQINNILITSFNKAAYIKYLTDIFGKEFFADVSVNDTDGYFANMHSHLKAMFHDAAKDIVFDVVFSVDLIEIKRSKGLGGAGNFNFSVLVSTDSLVEGKKQKLARTSWNYTGNHDIFTNPEAVFPKAKMTKLAAGKVRAKSKIKKSDFDAFFTKKYGAKSQKESGLNMDRYYITIKPDIELQISRMVFMRTPSYSVVHLAGGTPTKFGGFKYDWFEKPIKGKYYEESQETLDFFKNLIDNLKSSSDPRATFQKVVNQ